MSIIRKETNMIKATISNETKRNAFAKAGGRKIAGGICVSKAATRFGYKQLQNISDRYLFR